MNFHCKQPEIVGERKQDIKKSINRRKIMVGMEGFLSLCAFLQFLNHFIKVHQEVADT